MSARLVVDEMSEFIKRHPSARSSLIMVDALTLLAEKQQEIRKLRAALRGARDRIQPLPVRDWTLEGIDALLWASEPDDSRVQCVCGWQGMASGVKAKDNRCPECSMRFTYAELCPTVSESEQ